MNFWQGRKGIYGMMTDYPVIEGKTPPDMSGYIGRIACPTAEQLDMLEAENIRKAFQKYLIGSAGHKKKLFDCSGLQRLHKNMFNHVWAWAGEFRQSDIPIGVPYQQIREKLIQLSLDLPEWKKYEMPLLEQAVRLHHQAVQIHPFPNGNGRWSRLISNLWLRVNKNPIVMWPDEITKENRVRQEYILALRKADDMAYDSLIKLHQAYLES